MSDSHRCPDRAAQMKVCDCGYVTCHACHLFISPAGKVTPARGDDT